MVSNQITWDVWSIFSRYLYSCGEKISELFGMQMGCVALTFAIAPDSRVFYGGPHLLCYHPLFRRGLSGCLADVNADTYHSASELRELTTEFCPVYPTVCGTHFFCYKDKVSRRYYLQSEIIRICILILTLWNSMNRENSWISYQKIVQNFLGK